MNPEPLCLCYAINTEEKYFRIRIEEKRKREKEEVKERGKKKKELHFLEMKYSKFPKGYQLGEDFLDPL